MSELKITGNPNPIVGKEELYSVNQLLPSPLPFQNLGNATTNPFEQPVDWSVHILENGRWIKKEENNKRGNKVSYKFIQKSLERKGIRILAKRGEQTARLDVKPHKAESAKIDRIEFLDKNGKAPSKPFAYGQTLKARVHCLHMENRKVYATLWEDDAEGGGHNKANEKNKMKTLPGTVKQGIADIDFVLEPDFKKIANANGASSEGKIHEYYVTAEILNTKTASKNTNVAAPDYKTAPAKPTTPKKQTPAQKKGPSKKQEKEKSVLDEVIDWWEDKIKIDPIVLPDPIDIINSVLKVFTPDKEDVKKMENGVCVCKDYDLIWGNKVSCDFRKKVVEICKSLWPDKYKAMANGLMAVMKVETDGSFKAHQIMGRGLKKVDEITKEDFWLIKKDGTKTSRAVGLIQFTQDALERIGEFKRGTGFDKLHEVKLKFAKMGEIEQLKYVKKYFELNKDKIITPEDIYLHVFAPKGVGKSGNYVLYDEDIDGEKYRQNKSVDKENNNDKKIQRSEILSRYNDSVASGKASKENKFVCGLSNKTETGEINKYKIEVDKFKYSKILKSDTSKKYQYDLYDSDSLVKSIILQKNEHDLLPFPETGKNWGRFGTRDNGGDNWVDEEVCAALLGFFYSLPKNDYSGTLYFNDISANDSRNIGHAGHRVGNDIDIRYPGSTNTAGAILWSKASEYFSSKEKFIEVLENILSVALKWGFNKNYAYKAGIKNTTGKATSVHQDHFHIGLR